MTPASPALRHLLGLAGYLALNIAFWFGVALLLFVMAGSSVSQVEQSIQPDYFKMIYFVPAFLVWMMLYRLGAAKVEQHIATPQGEWTRALVLNGISLIALVSAAEYFMARPPLMPNLLP